VVGSVGEWVEASEPDTWAESRELGGVILEDGSVADCSTYFQYLNLQAQAQQYDGVAVPDPPRRTYSLTVLFM